MISKRDFLKNLGAGGCAIADMSVFGPDNLNAPVTNYAKAVDVQVEEAQTWELAEIMSMQEPILLPLLRFWDVEMQYNGDEAARARDLCRSADKVDFLHTDDKGVSFSGTALVTAVIPDGSNVVVKLHGVGELYRFSAKEIG